MLAEDKMRWFSDNAIICWPFVLKHISIPYSGNFRMVQSFAVFMDGPLP